MVKLADRYELGPVIGSGGMGQVVRGRDAKLGRDVAIKQLQADKLGDGAARERLLREARSAGALEHPGIVRVYDVGETEDGGVFLVMELVKGTTLRAAIDARIAGPAVIVRWIAEAARALGCAHASGLVHRDIKPENIMIRDDGRIVVLDFGLAKNTAGAARSSTFTEDGVIVGTPAYLTPEQASGMAVDARADQFALAVTAYEALCSRLPWRGLSVPAVFAEILRDTPAPASSVNATLPHALDGVLERAMAKSAEDRYPTMEAFADALGAIPFTVASGAAFAPTEALPSASLPPMPTVPGKSKRGSPRVARTLAALGIVAACVAVALFVKRPGVTAPVDAGATARGVPVTELPLPESRNAEAVAAYRAGVQAVRDGAFEQMSASFERAAKLDPGCAMAHARLADIAFTLGDVARSREELATASSLRSALSPRDRAYLTALEPIVGRDHPAVGEAIARYTDGIAAFPGDVDLLLMRAWAKELAGDYRAALADTDAAIALDPKFGLAFALEGNLLRILRREDEALRTFEACVAAIPAATICMQMRAQILSDVGECVEVGTIAARLIASAPGDPTGYGLRANLLVVQHAPRSAIDAAVAQWKATLAGHPDERRLLPLRAALAMGSFEEAEKIARETEAELADAPNLKPHALVARMLVDALLEEGQATEAGKAALAYLAKREVWLPDGATSGIRFDQTGTILGAAVGAGAISPDAGASLRETWVAQWRARGAPEPTLWLQSSPTEPSREEAAQAIASLPAAAHPDDDATWAAVVGELYRLSGDTTRAIPLLSHGARSCAVLEMPADPVRAALHLGQAHEASGDKTRACEAYARVIGRWGEPGHAP